MNADLANRIWNREAFHAHREKLKVAWLQRELGIAQTANISEEELVKCAQAATVLATSPEPDRQEAAYSIATSALDLYGGDLPGLAGILRVVLTRMGNFPAVNTAEAVRSFRRLPTRTAITEQTMLLSSSITVGDQTVVLTEFQQRLWRALTSGRNVAISAPTSAGKSFVLQLYLRDLARATRLSAAVYLVPSRALITQVTDAIATWRHSDRVRSLSIVNVPVAATSVLPMPAIYVLTQERLQAMIASHPAFAPGVVICDEAQSIQEGARGVLLDNVVDELRSRRPTSQFVFAGPNIKKALLT